MVIIVSIIFGAREGAIKVIVFDFVWNSIGMPKGVPSPFELRRCHYFQLE